MNHAAHYRISLLHGKIAVFTKSSIRSTYVPGSLWDSRHPHVGHGKMPMFLGEVLPSPSLNQATRGLRRAVVDAVPSTKSKNASTSGGQEEYTVPLKRMIKCSTIAASHATGFRDREWEEWEGERNAPPGRARRPRRAARMGTPSRRQRERLRDAGRRGRRPLPRMPREHHAPVPVALRSGVPPGRARRPRRAARMGTPSGRR